MNKSEIKQLLDSLEVGNYINELDYKIEEIDNDLYTVSTSDFDTSYKFWDELYDELMEHYIDLQANEQYDSLKHNQ